MKSVKEILSEEVTKGIEQIYQQKVAPENIKIERTDKQHEGEFTVVVFNFVKIIKEKPELIANELGNYLLKNSNIVESYSIVKGFLNLNLKPDFWLNFLQTNYNNTSIGNGQVTPETILVEYCGPNTNKPLHLGHIRNMLLGFSLAEILIFLGHRVIKANMYNDRGIAICKSMLAYQRIGGDDSPEKSNLKGDHWVGKYYVAFDKILKQEINDLMALGKTKEMAEREAPLLLEAQEMLRQWESGNQEILALWKKMNDYVYAGFETTYKNLGVNFDKNYYESKTYLNGKAIVEEGLRSGVFYKKEDNSIWVDLHNAGLDEKVLLRSDGTAVYLTQDLGTARQRYEDFKMNRSIYVVANEQDYHFKALKATLQKMNKEYAEGIYHLSYGMVDLPEGKMKSREGTVVDADDLIQEMINTAKMHTEELGKIEDFSQNEAEVLYHNIGLGALKFFILKVEPQKRMLFNPNESIDFHGQTGPFIQYTHARICSVLRQANVVSDFPKLYAFEASEKELILQLYQFSETVLEAGKLYAPSILANYLFALAKNYNTFYHQCPILKAESENFKTVRLFLSQFTAHILKTGLKLLGIEAPTKM